MEIEFVNKRKEQIVIQESNGKIVNIPPDEKYKLYKGIYTVDDIDFMEIFYNHIKEYFSGKSETKDINGKCTCSSFDVVNFGCKCGGK